MPFVSPVDVQLDEDDRTVVQPDVLIVCDRSKFQNGRVFGAPDFVVISFYDMHYSLHNFSEQIFQILNTGILWITWRACVFVCGFCKELKIILFDRI